MKVFVNYPTPEEEKAIYKMMTGAAALVTDVTNGTLVFRRFDG